SLSATVDARDSYTAGHSRRVQQLALAVGREMGLSQAELDLLGHAALFHDIGKLAIPDAILLKPTSLNGEEWALMQRHADEGARIIDRLGFLHDAVPAIRHHHERWDGTGYPDRLKGEEIPLGARIIHVADALDSMLTTRIYRAARPAHEAIEELRRAAGTQFCPRTVAALERILPLESILGDAVSKAVAQRPALVAQASSARRRARGADPRRASRERRAARPLADDAGVRGRSRDDRPSTDGDRALRQLERGQARGGARAAQVRDARGAAAAPARSGRAARPGADRTRPRRPPRQDAVEIALLAHVRVADERAPRGRLRRPGRRGAARARDRAGRGAR